MVDSLDPVDDLVAEYLRRHSAYGGDPLVELCAQHPQHAAELRARLERLGNVGLVRAPDEPMQIGPYRILDRLGEGGMGIVYAAEQRQPIHRRVALKVIKIGMDTREVLARFAAERQALALLDHPNIATVLDAGTSPEGRPYFAMELVRGVSITRYSDNGKLPLQQRLELVLQATAALQHAHERGIVHRDIKPSNLLVTEIDGRPVLKVIDFGLAKATNQRLTERTLFTEEGRIIGTPEYMSPEQAESSQQDIDQRTDVFSLGVVLYELIAGALPFDFQEVRKKGYLEMQRFVREEEAPTPSRRLSSLAARVDEIASLRSCRLRELTSSLKNGLEAVTMKAIAKLRRDRYASCTELAADLHRFLAGDPVLAHKCGMAARLSASLRRVHRRFPAALPVVVAGLLVGFGTWWWVKAGSSEVTDSRNSAQGQEQTDGQQGLAAMDNLNAAAGIITKELSRGVCLIHGIFRLRLANGDWALADAEPVEIEYTGSGFLATAAGHVVTNRHVVAPWTEMADLRKLDKGVATPEFIHLTATFPDRAPIDVPIASIQSHPKGLDVAVLQLPNTAIQGLPVLPLRDGSIEGEGQTVFLVGYPTGVQLLLARADEGVTEQLKGPSSSLTEVIAALSDHRMIEPTTTVGLVSNAHEFKLEVTAATTQGGSGSPVLDTDGCVVAVYNSMMSSFTAVNFGVPIRFARELLPK